MIFKANLSFRKVVDERGQRLRDLSFDDLKNLTETTEHVTLAKRRAKISIIVEPRPNDCLRVVVQGFLDCRLIPFIKEVSLDGFYKHKNGDVSPMPDEEFYEFD